MNTYAGDERRDRAESRRERELQPAVENIVRNESCARRQQYGENDGKGRYLPPAALYPVFHVDTSRAFRLTL